VITGVERTCFEQDLEPIFKQPQQVRREVVVKRSPAKEVVVE
jgi:hypothetical protein